MMFKKKIKIFVVALPVLVLCFFFLLVLDVFLKFSTIQKEYEFSYLLDDKTNGFTEGLLSNLSDYNDSEISLIISRPSINSKKNWISFVVFSTNEFHNFSLENIKIIFNEKTFLFRKSLKLDWEPKKSQYKFGEKIIAGYELRFYGNHENNYQVNLYKIFSRGKFNFGDEFDVQFIVNYSLDNRNYSKKISYVAKCIEAPQYPPNWFMRLFPCAY